MARPPRSTESEDDEDLDRRLAELEKQVDDEAWQEELQLRAAQEELGIGPRKAAPRKKKAKKKKARPPGLSDRREESPFSGLEAHEEDGVCRATPPDAQGARRIHVPCVRCRKLSRYKLRSVKPSYGIRCRGCDTLYKVELCTVVKPKVRRNLLGIFGGGLLGLLGSAAGTFAHYRMRVRVEDGSERERTVQFFALDPFEDMEFFLPRDEVALVHRKKELVAAANYTQETWLTTRAGGMDLLESMLGGSDADEDCEFET